MGLMLHFHLYAQVWTNIYYFSTIESMIVRARSYWGDLLSSLKTVLSTSIKLNLPPSVDCGAIWGILLIKRRKKSLGPARLWKLTGCCRRSLRHGSHQGASRAGNGHAHAAAFREEATSVGSVSYKISRLMQLGLKEKPGNEPLSTERRWWRCRPWRSGASSGRTVAEQRWRWTGGGGVHGGVCCGFAGGGVEDAAMNKWMEPDGAAGWSSRTMELDGARERSGGEHSGGALPQRRRLCVLSLSLVCALSLFLFSLLVV